MRHKMVNVGMLTGTLALFAAGAFVYSQNLTTHACSGFILRVFADETLVRRRKS